MNVPGKTKSSNEVHMSSTQTSPRATRSPVDIHEVTSLYSMKHNISEFLEMEVDETLHYPGTEDIEYAFAHERENVYSTNILESTAHLIKGCLGAGILAIHEGYSYGGLWASFIVAGVIGFILPYNMLILVKSAHVMYVRLRIPKMSFPDLIEAAIATGPIKCFRKYSLCVRRFTGVLLFIELCGTCNIYQVMMALSFKQILESLANTDLDVRICVLIVTIPILLLCCIRNLKYLAPFSLSADIFIIVCVIATLYYSMSNAADISERPAYKGFHGIVSFIGMYIYAIDGISLVLPIENNMFRPIYFSSVVWLGMSIVVISCNLVGFFGYWGWGEDCRSPLTMNMPPKNTVPLILQFFFVFIMPITFSVHFWVPFRLVWRYIGRMFDHKRRTWELIVRCTHVLIITAGTIAYPSVHELMTFMGLFFLPIISVVVPPFVEILVMWRIWYKFKRGWKAFFTATKSIMIIFFGMSIFVGGIVHNVLIAISDPHSDTESVVTSNYSLPVNFR